jgi:hypothetical protein
MCVEKPARQAASTDSAIPAPRRKRAVTERLHVFTPAPAAVAARSAVPRSEASAAPRTQAAVVAEPKRQQVTPPVSPAARKDIEKARTLPLAEARQPALGLARTQPLAVVSGPASSAAPQPRRVRPVAPLPEKSPVAAKPIEPIRPVPAPVKPITAAPASVKVSAPAVSAGILPPTSSVDDGWNQGRKRSRASERRPLRPLKVAEGTQPGVSKPTMSVPKAAGKGALKAPPAARPSERARLAEGSLPPPPTAPGKPLPSLFSVIDRKKPETQAADSSRLPGLPPPPPARPIIGPKKAVTTVVAAASLGSAQMAIAATRQTGQQSVVPAPAAQMLDDDDVEELEEIEEDLPDFVPSAPVVASILMTAKSAAPTPLFDAPRVVAMPPQAISFSAAERAFFAAGEEMDTIDMETEQETFDDLPGIERPSFWSRLKNRASAG